MRQLPKPDTHCIDTDTGLDVWSYSKKQMLQFRRDAERYRWLRQARSQHAQVMTWADGIDEWVVWHTAEDVDAAIDAAMKGTA